MEQRLIDANVLNARFEELKGNPQNTFMDVIFLDGAMSVVDAAPTIDCEPVKHARWEKDKDDMFWGNSFIHMRCSLCGSEAHLNRFGMAYVLSQFCPNCGAKMDGGK